MKTGKPILDALLSASESFADNTTRPPEQAVPVDWQALAISRYERVQELLAQRDRMRKGLEWIADKLRAEERPIRRTLTRSFIISKPY